ncbi:SulP family inorganic anion transporter [Paraburkholderia phenoliruptrix]|uniref:SulP family inorganic anion transporter n=2 Tax=Pseudomonadota TaxID=1224 RepID=UPI001C6E9B68|nr:SulP family inorganic anion transporter [Paraburkholderia phenoliruptrix]MBW9103044.1 SulP family inorganic anion transporter [Paraburkholderia phenoliruptrix]MBW9127849.1 SulP family inorganic anion transporter [Paraburkholderia ginsengiterrae]
MGKSHADTSSTPHRASAAGWLARRIPALTWMRDYPLASLPHDALAGLTLSAVLVPAGMAYAEAAGMPSVAGLYASLAALVAYALFGPSRILVVGPDSALVALILAAAIPLAPHGGPQAVMLAGALALLSGLLCAAVGLLKLGFIADLLSTPIRHGYLNGIMLTIIISQLPKLLGFPVKGESFLVQVQELVRGVLAGRINGTALAIGAGSLAVILACRRWAPRVPGVLIAVALATLVVSWANLAPRAGLAVVGNVPRGLPAPLFPILALREWLALGTTALAIALVTLTDVSMLSQTYGLRGGRQIDRDQECFAIGVANVAAALFQGFPVSASGSRTPVAEAAGAKTQLTGLVAAAIVAALLLFAPQALHDTPQAALAAVVIAASLGLLETRGMLRLYRLRRSEFVQALVCFLGVVLSGVVAGVGIALALAVLMFLWRAWRPYAAVLGRVDGVKGYHDISRHPDARRVPGLVLLRWDAPLFFANAQIFRERVQQAIDTAPGPTRRIVIAAEPVTDIDITAADMLTELIEHLDALHIQLCFAELKGPVKDSLKRYGIFERIGEHSFMPTVGRAVSDYVQTYRVEWHDWEDDA